MITMRRTNRFYASAKDGRSFQIEVYTSNFTCALMTSDKRDVNHRNVPGEFTIPSLGNLMVWSSRRECFCQHCQSVHAPGCHTRVAR